MKRLTQALNVLGYSSLLTTAFYVFLWMILLTIKQPLRLIEPNPIVLWLEVFLFGYGFAFSIWRITRYIESQRPTFCRYAKRCSGFQESAKTCVGGGNYCGKYRALANQ